MISAQTSPSTADPDTVRAAVLLTAHCSRTDPGFGEKVREAQHRIAGAETLDADQTRLAAVFDAAGKDRPAELSATAAARDHLGRVTRLYTGLIAEHGRSAAERVDRRTQIVTSLEGLDGDDARAAAVYDVARQERPGYLSARPYTEEQARHITSLRHRLRIEGAGAEALGGDIPATRGAAMDEWARLRGLAEVLRVDTGDTGPPPRKVTGMFTSADRQVLYLIDADGQVRHRRADAVLPSPWNPLDGVHVLDTTSLEQVTAAEVGRLGREAGRCLICNLPLRSEESRKRGMGERCSSRVS